MKEWEVGKETDRRLEGEKKGRKEGIEGGKKKKERLD